MFFDKILEFLKVENLYKNSDFRTIEPQNDNTKPIKNNVSPDYKHAYDIFSYWTKHSYSKIQYKYYREPSFAEKNEYALIDILSCFSKGARRLDNFSPIFLNNLGITNIQAYFAKLIDKKYLVKASPTDMLAANYNMKELKIIADSLGIKKTGKKDELVQRIKKEMSPQQLNQILNKNDLYVISDKGKEIINGNEDYLSLHKYLHLVSLAEFNDNRIPEGGTHPRNFYDTMFQILSNRKFFFECQGDYENAGFISLDLYNILIEENKKTTHNVPLSIILTNYVEHLYIYSCFCFHAYSALEYNIFSDKFCSYILPSPDKSLNMLMEQENYINYDMVFANKPPSFLTYKEFKKCIHEMLSEPVFDQQKWNLKIQNRIKEYENIIKENCSI